MSKPSETRLIMMVGQKWFDTSQGHQFCKLIPILAVNGKRVDLDDFENDGEIWWMLTAQSSRLAEPGRLVAGYIEEAFQYNHEDPHSSYWQVLRDSVRELGAEEGFQILDIPSNAIPDIQGIVSINFNLQLEISPTPQVFLRFRGNLYGPFNAAMAAASNILGKRDFTFSPHNHATGRIYRFDQKMLTDIAKDQFLEIEENVSQSSQRRSESSNLKNVRVNILLSGGLDRILDTNPQQLILKPLDQRLIGLAKGLVTRKNRQELQRLFKELETAGRALENASELMELIKHYQRSIEKQDEAMSSVTKALLESGLLGEDRIAKAQTAYAESYVQQRTAELEAKVKEALNSKTEELRKIEIQFKDIENRMAREELKRRSQFEQRLAEEREKHETELADEREKLENLKSDFSHQQKILKHNLEKVTSELRGAGDEVINRFLTIFPLLGTAVKASGESFPLSDKRDVSQAKAATIFSIPAYLSQNSQAPTVDIKEEEFFDRFQRLVINRGFLYRSIDLQRFHLSAKCGDMTVLGGPSGTGKSSLPSLYTEALLGEEVGTSRPSCLMVNVNPSWMEIRDLLGHMNSLEGKFYPAESGLFQHLIFAQEEYKSRISKSGLYMVCLDEMNLSQIEHYFSDFMMVLEREGTSRVIHCFSSEAAHSDCPFQAWGKLTLSPAVRFIGTVNFDETTRLLSDRFLDRVNLIRLSADSLPALTTSEADCDATAKGPMVTFQDYQSWVHEAALPTEIGLLVDGMRPMLSRMGVPLSPRVYRGICRFVNSAGTLMSAAKAFDVQVAQRVVPKIRTLITKSQMLAFDSLIQLLDESKIGAFDESMPMLMEIRESHISHGWDTEE